MVHESGGLSPETGPIDHPLCSPAESDPFFGSCDLGNDRFWVPKDRRWNFAVNGAARKRKTSNKAHYDEPHKFSVIFQLD